MVTSGDEPTYVADRPTMPGYGVLDAGNGGGLLAWDWARTRLEASRDYWLATADPSGAPHLAAVWGVWHDDRFLFSTGGRSVKARNLLASGAGRCCVAPELAAESIVVHGTAERVRDPTTLDELAGVYGAKYGSGFPDPGVDPVFAVRPTRVIAVVEADFTGRATRWTFSR